MNKRNVVAQDNQLVNAKYKLSRAELNFILLGIAQIKQEDIELTQYEIKVSDIEDKFNKKQNHTQLKVFAKKLMSKVLEVPTEDGWILFNWFSKIEYVNSQARFKVRIDMDLKPYLLQLRDRFTTYNLKHILPLTSNYSIRIYQFLKESEFRNDKKRTFTLDELHELLQVTKSYKIYSKFKQGILQTAQKELKEHCDIYFEFEEIKIGKRVNEIVFKIKSNIKEKPKAPQLFSDEVSADERLKSFVGQKIYIETNLYFFKSLKLNKDTSSNYYNNYIAFLTTPNGGTVKQQLPFMELDGAIDRIAEMIQRDDTKR